MLNQPDHKQAENAEEDLHQQREKLRIALANIGDGVITTDVHGGVTFMNPVAERLTGWSSDEALNRPLEDVFSIVDETTRATLENPIRQVLNEERGLGLANRTILIAKDGTERPIDDSTAPINDSDGTIYGCVLIFRDVSEQRRAERALRQSEQELEDIFENPTVSLHWVGPDGTILRVNQAELNLLGYRGQDYIGHNIAEFHANQEGADDILMRLSAGEALHEYPAQLRCHDNSIKEVLMNSTVYRVDGEFIHSRCITLDVTDRKRAEEAQGLLAAIVASSEDAIISQTLDSIITSWNAGAEKLFGYTASETVGQLITIIIHPDRREEEHAVMQKVRQGVKVGNVETIRIAKDGREVRVALTFSPILNTEGRVIGVSKVARDVTVRYEAENALRESEERFRMLADNISQLVWMVDTAGHSIWFNERWYEYTGLTPEEMQDSEVGRKLHHPDHIERFVANLRANTESGITSEEIFPLMGKDGNYHWFQSRVLPIHDDEGTVVRWFGTNTDITEQREAEEALKEADRRKDEFMAMLAHELRNPLAPIRNSLEIVKRADGDATLIEEARDMMDRQMTHLERLVDDLLDISRIRQDKIELRRERIDLALVIEQALETCRGLAASSGHELVVDIPETPICLDADPVRLGQVFSNLLNNACKYTPEGGRIELAVESEGDNVEISIKDTGLGIPSEMLGSIFEMFTQIQGDFRYSQGGLGIGLTLVRRLVEMHKGTVEALSEGAGRGSEIVVRLPRLVEEPSAKSPQPRLEDAPSERRCILIVDDNRDAANSLAILLKIKGHEIHLAYNGHQAIEQAEIVKPEVIFMDIGMPLLSGHEVARRIREQAWGKQTILVALTGWGQDEDRRKSNEAGFDYHLVKPVNPEVLLHLLSTLRLQPRDTPEV